VREFWYLHHAHLWLQGGLHLWLQGVRPDGGIGTLLGVVAGFRGIVQLGLGSVCVCVDCCVIVIGSGIRSIRVCIGYVCLYGVNSWTGGFGASLRLSHSSGACSTGVHGALCCLSWPLVDGAVGPVAWKGKRSVGGFCQRGAACGYACGVLSRGSRLQKQSIVGVSQLRSRLPRSIGPLLVYLAAYRWPHMRLTFRPQAFRLGGVWPGGLLLPLGCCAALSIFSPRLALFQFAGLFLQHVH
jgi:hypothetical protein